MQLEGKITMEELESAIHSIGRGKSSGPDALPAEFYSSFVTLVKHDFLRMLNTALSAGELHYSVREGDIILLHKKGDARDPRNYRPITLLQSDYKILAKILTNRLKKVIGNIISRDQLGFVPKRLIGEATHLLQLTKAYLDESGEPGILLALDWEKAFDR
eukprot:scaffold60497_cov36-Tisochrysis_lutea.AAC.2